MYQEWPDQMFLIVNFVFPHDDPFGRRGGSRAEGDPPPMVVGRSNGSLAGSARCTRCVGGFLLLPWNALRGSVTWVLTSVTRMYSHNIQKKNFHTNFFECHALTLAIEAKRSGCRRLSLM